MSIHNKINVAVIGATGYTGLDLILMLTKHPKVNLINLCATKNLGKKVSYFDKRIKKKLPKITSIKRVNWSSLDLVFLSLPNGEAQKLVKQIYFKYKNLRFIDLSADFRISNPKIFKKNYNLKHKAKNLIKDSIYSLPELNYQKIDKFRIISNPGCYTTSIQLALVPLFKRNMIKTYNITIDAKSGFLGAG